MQKDQSTSIVSFLCVWILLLILIGCKLYRDLDSVGLFQVKTLEEVIHGNR